MMRSVATPTGDRVRADWTALAREAGSALRRARGSSRRRRTPSSPTTTETCGSAGCSRPACPPSSGAAAPPTASSQAMLRVLGQHCGSTALALAMHTHQVAIARLALAARRRRRWSRSCGGWPPQELIIATSGGSDWLAGSGRAEKVDGGYRVSGRKVFASGSPAADVFTTMAVYDDPETGPTVLHFAVPLDERPGSSIADNWRTLGMRGTGSNDVVLDGVFVPDAAVNGTPAGGAVETRCGTSSPTPRATADLRGLRRRGRGGARARACARRRAGATTRARSELVGEHRHRARRRADGAAPDARRRRPPATPGLETTNEVMIGRTVAGQAAIRTVELAMEVAGRRRLLPGRRPRATVPRRPGRALPRAARRRPAHLSRGGVALGLDVNESDSDRRRSKEQAHMKTIRRTHQRSDRCPGRRDPRRHARSPRRTSSPTRMSKAADMVSRIPAPPITVRMMAIVQVSVFEAVNTITGALSSAARPAHRGAGRVGGSGGRGGDAHRAARSSCRPSRR